MSSLSISTICRIESSVTSVQRMSLKISSFRPMPLGVRRQRDHSLAPVSDQAQRLPTGGSAPQRRDHDRGDADMSLRLRSLRGGTVAEAVAIAEAIACLAHQYAPGQGDELVPRCDAPFR
jgi:hypothetical protein